MDGIKIFYDGTDIPKFADVPGVVGFTTNCSFMKAAGLKNYSEFYESVKAHVRGRPLSLQCWEDEPEALLLQARQVCALGSNVFAKIPVTSSTGASNVETATTLLREGLPINATAIFTMDQLQALHCAVSALPEPVAPLVVSIFCGRIDDTGVDPKPLAAAAAELFSKMPQAEVLWAGCKSVVAARHAAESGCQIVTVPGDILTRMHARRNKNLLEFSVETAKMFRDDAVGGGLSVL
jgi:transaldolase